MTDSDEAAESDEDKAELAALRNRQKVVEQIFQVQYRDGIDDEEMLKVLKLAFLTIEVTVHNRPVA